MKYLKRTHRLALILALCLAVAVALCACEDGATAADRSESIASLADSLPHAPVPGVMAGEPREFLWGGSFLAPHCAEAMLLRRGTALALLPAGALAGGLEAGSLTMDDVERVLPEDLPLVEVVLSGAQVRETLEAAVAASSEPGGE